MSVKFKIRPESKEDKKAIEQVIKLAFETHPYSNQTEHLIVDELREDLALSISLVAETEDKIIGHIAFSEIQINKEYCAWFGLAPVSVLPEYQNQGIGSVLIKTGLQELIKRGANGCVLVGEPDYYTRFGFNHQDKLTFEGVPEQYFLALSFEDDIPDGAVSYHSAFSNNG